MEASQDAIKRSCVQVASDHEASVKAVVEEFKAAGLVRTFSRTRSARFAHFRNLEVWCWDRRGSIFEGEGFVHGIVRSFAGGGFV